MSTTTSSSKSIQQIFCSDPNEGAVYRLLFNGGSWFEAEQMHWRILHARTLEQITTLCEGKPTKSNLEKLKGLLLTLQEASKQLVPDTEYMAIYHKAEALVTKWSAPLTRPVKKGFAALADSDDEE